MVSRCSICLDLRDRPPPEPLCDHEIPKTPWTKVGTDLFVEKNKDHLIIIDYLTSYPHVYELPNATSKSVIQAVKASFSRFRVPDQVVNDRGPCYASDEFTKFAEEWDLEQIMSSPTYPRSNVLAERTVKTVKYIFKKEKNPQLGIMAYRNAELNTGNTPAELNLGCRARCNLPSIKVREKVAETFIKRKENDKIKQKHYHDIRGVKPLPALQTGDRVRVYHPTRTWRELAAVLEKAENARSYHVLTDCGSKITRNQQHLLKSAETPPVRVDPGLTMDLDVEPLHNEPEVATKSSRPPPTPNQVAQQSVEPPMPSTPIDLRRSTRVVKRLDRLIENM